MCYWNDYKRGQKKICYKSQERKFLQDSEIAKLYIFTQLVFLSVSFNDQKDPINRLIYEFLAINKLKYYSKALSNNYNNFSTKVKEDSTCYFSINSINAFLSNSISNFSVNDAEPHIMYRLGNIAAPDRQLRTLL